MKNGDRTTRDRVVGSALRGQEEARRVQPVPLLLPPRIGPDGRFAFVVQLPGSGSRITVADAALRGRRTIQSGTAVDWRPY